MRTTQRTVYPGFPSKSAAQAARARSMTRLRFGAPPAPNSRDKCSRVTRSAWATWAVLVGVPARRRRRGGRDPFAGDGVVHAFHEHGEPGVAARREQLAVIRPHRR